MINSKYVINAKYPDLILLGNYFNIKLFSDFMEISEKKAEEVINYLLSSELIKKTGGWNCYRFINPTGYLINENIKKEKSLINSMLIKNTNLDLMKFKIALYKEGKIILDHNSERLYCGYRFLTTGVIFEKYYARALNHFGEEVMKMINKSKYIYFTPKISNEKAIIYFSGYYFSTFNKGQLKLALEKTGLYLKIKEMDIFNINNEALAEKEYVSVCGRDIQLNYIGAKR